MKRFNVKGFPSFFMVRKGIVHPYADREYNTLFSDNVENLVKFAKVRCPLFVDVNELKLCASLKGGFMNVEGEPIPIEPSLIYQHTYFLIKELAVSKVKLGMCQRASPC
jgi:hypothetical protein